jgi:aminoglycoside phosphotransferase (APT) family kinase protein
MDVEAFSNRLEAILRQRMPGVTAVAGIARLSGGASQETWSLDAVGKGVTVPLVLRRSQGGAKEQRKNSLDVEAEAHVLGVVRGGGVPVPQVRLVLKPEDGLGHGFLMDRVEGEALPRRILRDEVLKRMHPTLVAQLGETLARIHRFGSAELPALRSASAEEEILYHREMYEAHGHPHPVFDLAFRWLLDHLPETQPLALVHGDFRNGNFIVGAEGLRSVLDWELAHIGDPMEDLGWICVNSWRFGLIDLPVGGFGRREQLFEAYEKAGGSNVEPERVRFWEVFGTLKWGILCLLMVDTFRHGNDRSIERAAIGRRASETEIDLLRLLAPRG